MIRRWYQFRRDQKGVAALEFALFAPVLIALILGSLTAFGAYQTSQAVAKATSTIGDMMARRQRVDLTFAQSMDVLLRQLVPGTIGAPGLRLTSVSNVNGTMTRDWTTRAGNVTLIPPGVVSTANLPTIAVGDSVLITESFVPFSPLAVGFGLNDFIFRETLVNRPRFVRRVPFDS